MSGSDAPLFSQLGFSRELYEIRQKNGRWLLGAAWLLEVIAACIGLLIAGILILQGYEGLVSDGGQIPSSMKYSVLIGGLPFVMSAIVELMKIPIVTLVYHSQSLLWKSVFVIALAALAFITFETMAAGMQQGYQVRTGTIQKLSQDLGRANDDLKSLVEDIQESTSIDTSSLDERRRTLEQQLSEARAESVNQAQIAINDLRQRLGEGSASTAQAQLDRLTTQRESLSSEQALELEGSQLQYAERVTRAENIYALEIEELTRKSEQVTQLYSTEVANCRGIFGGGCQNQAEQTRDQGLAALELPRTVLAEQRDSEIGEARVLKDTRDSEIRANFAARLSSLDERIEIGGRELNEARNVSNTNLESMVQEIEVRRDREIEALSSRIESQLEELNGEYAVLTAPADRDRISQKISERQKVESKIAEISSQLDQESGNNQIYQIAKLAMSICFAVPDDQCEKQDGGSSFRYSDLPPEYIEKISIYWFGSLAFIMSTIGIMLAFGAMVLKYEHIDEHGVFKRWLIAVDRNLSALLGGIVRIVTHIFSFANYFFRTLRALRKYLIYRAKFYKKEPRIIEKEVIVKEEVEVQVEKIVTKDVVREVPVEKIVIQTRDKLIPVTSKEFVYVPFYSDDPKDREIFEKKMEELKLTESSAQGTGEKSDE
ncbi:hypothetical protein N9513_08120 [Gammaproteobacteria bacterium]|nr:hypothetical protein [Gammaproteobacteria bacterium]